MNIAIVGTGYVGLVTGTCLSEFGMNVMCVDIDEDKIKMLKSDIIPIYESGLEDLVKKNSISGRLTFDTNIKSAVEKCDVIFLAVGTPPLEDGSADMKYVLQAARDIGQYINSYKIIINKSTVPVGTGKRVKDEIANILKQRKVDFEFDVVSNPEFLREGAAVRDFMHPDRIVIGTESEKAIAVMKNIYDVFNLSDVPFVITNIETAEMIKYASNAFLAIKISYINEIANMCELVGADVYHVAKAMGLDSRIGSKFLHPGPGFGGSCFPKDTKALVNIGENIGYIPQMVESCIKINENQWIRMVNKIEKVLGGVEEKNIGILGLSFKPETDDLRESPALYIVEMLLSKKANIKVYDPIAMDNMKKLYPQFNVQFCKDEYEVCKDCDCVVLLTEWNQFRSLSLTKLKALLNSPVFFDFRNVFQPEDMKQLGFIYVGVGR